jgi:hypothetical protein
MGLAPHRVDVHYASCAWFSSRTSDIYHACGCSINTCTAVLQASRPCYNFLYSGRIFDFPLVVAQRAGDAFPRGAWERGEKYRLPGPSKTRRSQGQPLPGSAYLGAPTCSRPARWRQDPPVGWTRRLCPPGTANTRAHQRRARPTPTPPLSQQTPAKKKPPSQSDRGFLKFKAWQ